MDGKPIIKIMSKTELLSTMRVNDNNQNRPTHAKKFSTRKRGSTPLISTSISAQRKNTTQVQTLRKVQRNNFITSNSHAFTITSSKRLSQCHTALGMRTIKREDNHMQKSQAQKYLLKNSDKLHKLLWNQSNQNLSPLILSADLVMDQDCFWSTSKIQTTVIKSWKEIHKFYFVIWIVKSQKGFKRLKDFSECYQLALNAVYFQKRQSRYTIDFTMIKKQLGKAYGSSLSQIIAIECLKLSSKHVYQSSSFLGRVPIMFDPRFRVCFIRTQQSAQGLDKVLEIGRAILTRNQNQKNEKLIILKSIPVFIQNHFKGLQEQSNFFQQKLRTTTIFEKNETQFINQELIEQELQIFKRELIQQVIKEKGRNFQFEGFSVHYFVGDIVKRNYDMLYKKALERCQNKKILYAQKNNFQKSKIEGKLKSQLQISEFFYQYYI